jgi:hypothetical protein
MAGPIYQTPGPLGSDKKYFTKFACKNVEQNPISLEDMAISKFLVLVSKTEKRS